MDIFTISHINEHYQSDKFIQNIFVKTLDRISYLGETAVGGRIMRKRNDLVQHRHQGLILVSTVMKFGFA
jgi:hypothetical protein